MKYLKLFEEFSNQDELILELISNLKDYMGMKETDSLDYLDTLGRISEVMEKYKELYEYLVDEEFEDNGSDILMYLRDIHSHIGNIEGMGEIERSGGLLWEMYPLIQRYIDKMTQVLDVLDYSKSSSDGERSESAQRDVEDMLGAISEYHKELVGAWGEVLDGFDSVDRLEKKLEVLKYIMSLLGQSEVKSAIFESIFEKCKKIELGIEKIILAIRDGRIYNKRGIMSDELDKMIARYSFLRKDEEDLEDMIDMLEIK